MMQFKKITAILSVAAFATMPLAAQAKDGGSASRFEKLLSKRSSYSSGKGHWDGFPGKGEYKGKGHHYGWGHGGHHKPPVSGC